MAIRFTADITILIADIIAGGFVVQAIQNVPDSRGRTTDVRLKNDVVVCWDSLSNVVWAEGSTGQVSDIERYLRNLYEGPQFLRWLVTRHSRWILRVQSAKHTTALWLLRSETRPARFLRQLIQRVPSLFLRRHRHVTPVF